MQRIYFAISQPQISVPQISLHFLYMLTENPALVGFCLSCLTASPLLDLFYLLGQQRSVPFHVNSVSPSGFLSPSLPLYSLPTAMCRKGLGLVGWGGGGYD